MIDRMRFLAKKFTYFYLDLLDAVGVVVLMIGIAGCATKTVAPAAPVAVSSPALPPAPTALSEDAKAALVAAEQSIVNAEVTRTLWVSAKEKIIMARLAAKQFDSSRTLALARDVVALCERSTAQAKSPPVTW